MAKICLSTKDYRGDDALHNVVNYVIRESKACGDYGAQGVLMHNPLLCMDAVRKFYQNTGKQVIHFWLSFSNYDCVAVFEAINIGRDVASFFKDYQVVYGCHQDTDYLHIHVQLKSEEFH